MGLWGFAEPQFSILLPDLRHTPRQSHALTRHIGLLSRSCDGLPSPSLVPPIRNPEKPRVAPRLRGFFIKTQ